MNLRPYQQASIDHLYHWWMAHPGHHEAPVLVAPTGSGKSLVIAELTRLLFDTWPDQHPRTLIIVPSKELAEQNADKLVRLLPSHLSIGYYSASIGKHPTADVIVATIGSVYKAAHILGNIKCVIVDECFTGDTLISTTHGQKRIDEIRLGESVYTATGTGTVKAVSKRSTHSLCIVRLSNGTEIKTTDNHPFFTRDGWKAAKDLARGDGVVRIQDMYSLWENLSSMGKRRWCWKRMQSPAKTFIREGSLLLNILLEEQRECDVDPWGKGENVCYSAQNKAQAINTWWKRNGDDESTEGNSFDFVGWMGAGTGNKNWRAKEIKNISTFLQGGYWKRESEDCHRTGWGIAQRKKKATRRKEGQFPCFTWVESISREELSSPEPVFNLQIGGHPSYYANGTLVHNCHLINPNGCEQGRYRQFLTELAKYCAFRVVGLTATPFRGNGVWLTEGETPLFTGIAHTITVQSLIDDGYLAPLVRPIDALQTRIDTDGIKTTSGDFNLDQLETRVDEYLERIADETLIHAEGRKKWIAFTPTVVTAGHLRDEFVRRGISAYVVCGSTPKQEREDLIAKFRAGEIRCLVTVLALATGFDVPDVDCIIWARPTQSPVLYVQGAGRGMRIAPGKTDCLWIDFSDTTERLGPVDAIKGRKKSKKVDREAPFKICDACGERCLAGAFECPSCGHVFPTKEKEIRSASDAPILSAQVAPKIVTYPVTDVRYSIHKKPGSPDSLRVDYWSGLRKVASEWVCFEHDGWARAKAEAWWNRRKPSGWVEFSKSYTGDVKNFETPTSMAFLFSKELSTPSTITVNESGRWPEIVKVEFTTSEEEVTA